MAGKMPVEAGAGMNATGLTVAEAEGLYSPKNIQTRYTKCRPYPTIIFYMGQISSF
jgi:hypothetical protein